MIWNNLGLEVKQNLFSIKKQKLQKRLHWDSNVQSAKLREWILLKDAKLLFSLMQLKRKTLKIKIDSISDPNKIYLI